MSDTNGVPGDVLYDAETPAGFRVRVGRARWAEIITLKHAVMAGREGDVLGALTSPDEVRLSRSDPSVYLFYRAAGDRWVCAVAKRLAGHGFLITAYPTDAIKVGDRIWPP